METAIITCLLTSTVMKSLTIYQYIPDSTNIFNTINTFMSLTPNIYLYTWADPEQTKLLNHKTDILKEKVEFLIIRNLPIEESDFPIALTWTTQLPNPDKIMQDNLNLKSKLTEPITKESIDEDYEEFQDPKSPCPEY